MPLYDFTCEKCKIKVEYFYKIEELPSSLECEKCGSKLIRLYNCEFILKGSDWPGKSIKLSQSKIENMDANEKILDEHNNAQKEANEVLEQRRKGRNSFNEYEKHNKKKVARYKKNMKKGITGK